MKTKDTMTVEEAKAFLKNIGMTLGKDSGNDYRVTHTDKNGKKISYFTPDLEDAVASGIMMHEEALKLSGESLGVRKLREIIEELNHEIKYANNECRAQLKIAVASIKTVIESKAQGE